MDQKELISVIVPIYNIQNYLKRCVDSIINQTYKNIEIILVDDGSTDNSSIICDGYQALDNRITVIHKTNGGLSSARNAGLDFAKGDLISFVDGDDYLEPTFLKELKANMDLYKSDVAICNLSKILNKKKTAMKYSVDSFFVTGDNKYQNIFNEYKLLTVVAWNKLYRKKLFDNIRYPEGKIFEDSFIICDLLEKSNKVSYILKPLYNYVSRENSLINTFTINHFDEVEATNRRIFFLIIRNYPI